MNNKELIKISILKDGDRFAYMEYQSGNDPKVYNNTYGTSGYWSFEEVCEAVITTYKDFLIDVTINL